MNSLKLWALDPRHAPCPDDPQPQAESAAAAAEFQLRREMQGSRPAYTVNDGVAVISIEGPLTRTAETDFFGTPVTRGYDEIMQDISAALDDPAVSAILLSVSSPGGEVAGVQSLADFIARSSARKPMAAYTDSLMASAAYWLSSATGRIFATETAEVGSIGVIMTLFDMREANAKKGIAVNLISSGDMKTAGSPYQELTEEQRAYFQEHVEKIHAIFRSAVAAKMPVDADAAKEWADGQIFLAADAAAAGLVTNIVADLNEAAKILSMEVRMDKAELLEKYPDLAAELIAEGRAQAEGGVPLKVLEAFLDESALARIQEFTAACQDAGMTAEQMAAVAKFSAAPAAAAPAPAAEEKEPVPAAAPAPSAQDMEARAALLAAIQAASAPLDAAAPAAAPTPRDVLMRAAAAKA